MAPKNYFFKKNATSLVKKDGQNIIIWRQHKAISPCIPFYQTEDHKNITPYCFCQKLKQVKILHSEVNLITWHKAKLPSVARRSLCFLSVDLSWLWRCRLSLSWTSWKDPFTLCRERVWLFSNTRRPRPRFSMRCSKPWKTTPLVYEVLLKVESTHARVLRPKGMGMGSGEGFTAGNFTVRTVHLI